MLPDRDVTRPLFPLAPVKPNGLVDLGRWLVVGIKLSRLTSDEFSPRKLSGVFVFLFVEPINVGFAVDTTGKGVTCGAVLHGLVGFVFRVDIELVTFDAPPKKSSNGSLLTGLTAGGDCIRFVVNTSKLSSRLLDGLLAPSSFMGVDDDDEVDHGSFSFIWSW